MRQLRSATAKMGQGASAPRQDTTGMRGDVQAQRTDAVPGNTTTDHTTEPNGDNEQPRRPVDVVDLTKDNSFTGGASAVGSRRKRARGNDSGSRFWTSSSQTGNQSAPVLVITDDMPMPDNDDIVCLGGGIATDNAIKKRKANSADEQSDTGETSNLSLHCPVCMDSFVEINRGGIRHIVSTNCGHLFCNDCMKKAMNANFGCPKCRSKATPKDIRKIYM